MNTVYDLRTLPLPILCVCGARHRYTFNANDGWRIKNSMGGQPWRTFAYIEPCGPNNSNSCVNEMAFSFKFQDSVTWGGWIDLLFFGDSNKVLGLWPNKGMQLVGFPPGDMPNTWAGNLTLVDGDWFDVKVTLGIGSSNYLTAEIAHDDQFVKWTSPEPRTALNRAYIGMYTFAPAGPAVTLSLKNFCMGKDNTCNWKCGSGGGSIPSPSQQPIPSPSRNPVTPPVVTPSPSSRGQVLGYGRCGGVDYNGPTSCVSGYHCKLYCDWYSQCIPDHN
ncbi:unnamed protein product [Aphanomyces euteiches]